ncbi:UPF0235 protein C15orf40 homolog [Echeneis naucrates]|uniref:Uncharacterized protein n=1 Tax=Echeneis naucrates TaxID=173247 RepID=A0A665VQT9_ECHNA|nr:UPF0235 protein C15orf40 homolog [Echeneis naucrates]
MLAASRLTVGRRMFSRSGSAVTCGFFRSFVRLSDVIRPVTVHGLSRCPLRPGVSGKSRHLCTKMPRRERGVKAPPAAGAAARPEPSGPVAQDKNGAVTIVVHAKPGSKHNSITGVSTEAVGVAIAAPPTDGEANTELIRFLAEILELKKNHISLDKGSRSRDKLIRVNSSLSPEDVLQRLRQAAG